MWSKPSVIASQRSLSVTSSQRQTKDLPAAAGRGARTDGGGVDGFGPQAGDVFPTQGGDHVLRGNDRGDAGAGRPESFRHGPAIGLRRYDDCGVRGFDAMDVQETLDGAREHYARQVVVLEHQGRLVRARGDDDAPRADME